jgi:glycosyl transferase family 87
VDVRRGLVAVLAAAAVLIVLVTAAPAAAQSALHTVTQDQAEKIAAKVPEAVEAKAEHPDLNTVSERQDSGNWQVGFVADGKEIVQVVVSSITGGILETWTGDQVAWRMARGYDGAFGRKINAPYVWLPLCAIFILGLFDFRRPFRAANLDLLALTAGIGVSHFFFNRGEIGLSVPLAYPVLLYLLGRALWMAFRGASPLRPSVPATWLAIATLFLLGFRVGLDVTDSNVIDVGYSGVIGADRIADGETLYGNFPSNDQHGDTYGPFAYYAYVPFEQALPWSGAWDDLPAAHAASIFFDLFAAAGLFLLGRRLRPPGPGREAEEPGLSRAGTDLGSMLAFAWAACPYTAFALESNTNDALVAALVIGALCVLAGPVRRGIAVGLAAATKFAPLALAPLFATYQAGPGRRRWASTVGRFTLALAATIGVLMAWALIDPGLHTFVDRTIDFQGDRGSPFSIWGQADLGPLHAAVYVLAASLAVLVAFRPRRRTPETVAILAAAVLIAVELTMDHWFYLYIPWFFGAYAVGMLAGVPGPAALDD